MANRKTNKVKTLLDQHKVNIIEQLGQSAFDILTPYEAAQIAGINTDRIPDLIREGWLEPVSGKDIGRAHQYYRWQAIFTRQFRKTRKIDNSTSR